MFRVLVHFIGSQGVQNLSNVLAVTFICLSQLSQPILKNTYLELENFNKIKPPSQRYMENEIW